MDPIQLIDLNLIKTNSLLMNSLFNLKKQFISNWYLKFKIDLIDYLYGFDKLEQLIPKELRIKLTNLENKLKMKRIQILNIQIDSSLVNLVGKSSFINKITRADLKVHHMHIL